MRCIAISVVGSRLVCCLTLSDDSVCDATDIGSLCPAAQVAERAQVLGSGLLAKGCQPNPKQFVGIFAQNRPEVNMPYTHTHAYISVFFFL